MEHLSNDQDGHPNQHKNSHKLCSEMGYPTMNLMESQWKPRQQHDQKFPNGRKPIVEQIPASEEINPKEQDCKNHSLGFK